MDKLLGIAKRIGEIGDEIAKLKRQRLTNLDKCGASDEDDFGSQREMIDYDSRENCLNVAYRWSKEDRELYDDCFESLPRNSFYTILKEEGCQNCIAAYEQKRLIGKLKQERGRLVGAISRIGKSL